MTRATLVRRALTNAMALGTLALRVSKVCLEELVGVPVLGGAGVELTSCFEEGSSLFFDASKEMVPRVVGRLWTVCRSDSAMGFITTASKEKLV